MTAQHWIYRTEENTDFNNLNSLHFQAFNFLRQNARELSVIVEQLSKPTLIINHDRWTNPADLTRLFKLVIQAAKQYVNFDHVLVDASIDPVDYQGLADQLNLVAQELNVTKIVILGGFNNITYTNAVVVPGSFWYFHSNCLLTHKYSHKTINMDQPRSREFSCLNRNPKDHRLVFYSILKERGLLDSFIYSFHDRWTHLAHLATEPLIQDQLPTTLILPFTSERWIKVQTDVRDFPITWPGQITGGNDHGIDHPAYHDAYCNVVTETVMETDFISEKIWKPIAAGQLFLVIGSRHTCKWLNDLGFYTFENEHYDNEQDHITRIEKVADIVSTKRNNVRQWWLDNIDKIQHNRSRFNSTKFQSLMVNQVAEHF